MKDSILFLSILSIFVSRLEAAEAATVCEEYQVQSVIDAQYPVAALSVNKQTGQIAACCRPLARGFFGIGDPESEKGKPVDQCVYIWDYNKSTPRHILHNNIGRVTALHWHPNQEKYSYLVTGSQDKTIKVLNPNLAFGKEKQSLSDGAMGEVRAVVWHPIQDILVSVSYDAQASANQRNALRIWRPSWWSWSSSTLHGHQDTINAIGWNASGDTLISGGEKEMKIWDPQQGHQRRTVDVNAIITALDWQDENAFVTGANLLDGKGFFSTSSTLALILWDKRNMSKAGLLTGHESKITSVKSNPAFPYELISASDDGTIRSWDVRTLNGLEVSNINNIRRGSAVACLQVLQEHNDAVTSVDFYSSNSEHKFASGSSDKTIRVITKPVSTEPPDRQYVHDAISKKEKEEEATRKKKQKEEEVRAQTNTEMERAAGNAAAGALVSTALSVASKLLFGV